MLAISAIFEIKPEYIEEFRKLSQKHSENCLKEKGCLGFDVFQAHGAPSKFYFHERYTDQAAVDLHGTTAYFADFIEQATKMAVSKDIVVWSAL